jgi:hypothetical protein
VNTLVVYRAGERADAALAELASPVPVVSP